MSVLQAVSMCGKTQRMFLLSVFPTVPVGTIMEYHGNIMIFDAS